MHLRRRRYHSGGGIPAHQHPHPEDLELLQSLVPDVTRVDIPGLQQPGIQLLEEEPFDLLAEQKKQYARLGRIQELKGQAEEGIVDPEYARLLQEEEDYQVKYKSLYPEDRLTMITFFDEITSSKTLKYTGSELLRHDN